MNQNQNREITIGLKGKKSITTTDHLSAQAMGSGSVPDTYATPAMLALMESAAVQAIESYVSEGSASVGIAAHIQHLAATPIGNKVRAEATVTGVEGRKISFEIIVFDEHEEIGRGSHDRVIINEARFVERLAAKRQQARDE